MDDRTPAHRYMQGAANVVRVGRFRFPAFELRQGDEVLASLGRSGVIKIMFGRGQRVELADGTAWRVRAMGNAGAICPVVVDAQRRRITISYPREDRYALNGRDYGCVLFAAKKRRFSRADEWILREHETEVATFTRYPASLVANEPVHLGAVILAFTLIQHGILGESKLRFNARWDG